MRRFLVSITVAGAILATGVIPASASAATTATTTGASAAGANAVPNAAQWEWVDKGLYGTYELCYLVGRTFSPYQFECVKYSIGARPGDYEWMLYVLELVN